MLTWGGRYGFGWKVWFRREGTVFIGRYGEDRSMSKYNMYIILFLIRDRKSLFFTTYTVEIEDIRRIGEMEEIGYHRFLPENLNIVVIQ